MPPLIEVKATIVGAVELQTKLSITAPNVALARLRDTVRTMGFLLQRKVVAEKLNGVVLNRRSGRLARSINTQFESGATSETAKTGTSVKYGRIWELTGSRAFVMTPSKKKALFWPGAAHPVASVNRKAQAKRPFLRPALEELRPTITAAIANTARGL